MAKAGVVKRIRTIENNRERAWYSPDLVAVKA
jgi:hypothetical protein